MRKQERELKRKDKAVSQGILTDVLKMSNDFCVGDVRVTLTGNREAWIENYKGILEYSTKTIRLQTKTGQICFDGSELLIDYYTNEDMRIIGRLEQIRFI